MAGLGAGLAHGAGLIRGGGLRWHECVRSVSDLLSMRSCIRILIPVLCGAFLAVSPGRAQTSMSKAEHDLIDLVERQRSLLALAAEAEHTDDIEDLRPRMQDLVFDYERYLRTYDEFVPGYISYSMLLGDPLIDERKRAMALLLRANDLDPNLAIVKNQLGKYLAEDGRPLEAVNYFISAAELEPNEALYHYQIAQVLTGAHDDFLKSGEWTVGQVEEAMRHAYEEAVRLAPDNFAYAYSQAESFYEMRDPDWNEALTQWRALEARVETPVERQMMQLHQANVYLSMHELEAARLIMNGVSEDLLQPQKERLERRIRRIESGDEEREKRALAEAAAEKAAAEDAAPLPALPTFGESTLELSMANSSTLLGASLARDEEGAPRPLLDVEAAPLASAANDQSLLEKALAAVAPTEEEEATAVDDAAEETEPGPVQGEGPPSNAKALNPEPADDSVDPAEGQLPGL